MTSDTSTISESVFNIKLYTSTNRDYVNEQFNLFLTNNEEKNDDDTDNYYNVTPNDLKIIEANNLLSNILIDKHDIYLDMTIDNIVQYSNVETLVYFYDTFSKSKKMIKSNWYLFIITAFRSNDNRMWKQIVDIGRNMSYRNDEEMITYITLGVANDEHLDKIICLIQYVRCRQKLVIAPKFATIKKWFRHCIDKNNYKLLKHLMSIWKELDVYIDIDSIILYAILASKHEFVDLLLSHQPERSVQCIYVESEDDAEYKFHNLADYIFMHELYINERIHIDTIALIRCVRTTMNNHLECAVYLLTVFPWITEYIYKSHFSSDIFKEFIKDLERDNEELLKLELCLNCE